MPRRKRAKRAKNSGISEHQKKKRMTDVARCWCQGYGIGCGKVIGARASRKHAQKERERALREELLDDSSSESEESEDLEDDLDEPVGDDGLEVGGDRDAGRADAEVGVPDGDNGGGDGGFDEGFDFDMEGPYDDMWMDAGPDVQLAFDLGDAGADDMDDDDEEPWIDPEDEEDLIELVWDQAESDSEDEDMWRTADEREKWEKREHFRLEYDEEQFTQEDLDDIEALAYNLKHGHSRKALEDLSRMNRLSSPYVMKRKLQTFSNLVEERYDCCVASCMAFTGPYKDLEKCKICDEPRYDNRGKAHNIFPRIAVY